MNYALLTATLLASVAAAPPKAPAEPPIDFNALSSPIILKGDMRYAHRDPAVTYHDGKFYLFFTWCENKKPGQSKTKEHDPFYWTTAFSVSSDLVNWTKPKSITPEDQTLNFSSPGNIVRWKDEWILCLQTYPRQREDRRIWIVRSKDLENWSDAELLKVKGNDVPREKMGKMIDPYLIRDAKGMWWCFYKQNGVSYSKSPDLKNWTYVGRASAGENVTIIKKGDRYHLFHSPGSGVSVKTSKDLLTWPKENLYKTSLGQADWDWATARLTAATAIDLTREPRVGKYVLFFHASFTEAKKVETGHGGASLAFAWSDDLVHWEWAGKKDKEDKQGTAAEMME